MRARAAWLATIAVAACACGRTLVIGADPPVDAGVADASSDLLALPVPWSTGFESGFGDWYTPPTAGLCYEQDQASFAIVTSPVHGGTHAAAFFVDTNSDSGAASQTRCYRQGVLPPSAYYGAWFYIPAPVTVGNAWNLFHFQGASGPGGAVVELWDVSLVSQADGSLTPIVMNFQQNTVVPAGPAVPIGTWFHVEMLLKVAADPTGEVTLLVDGAVGVDLTNIATDATAWAQWFVGSYATSLTPAAQTLYVDDVSIDTSGP